MIKFIKLILTSLAVFIISLNLVTNYTSATIFSGTVETDDPGSVGYCLRVPEAESCHEHEDYDYEYCYDPLHPERKEEERCETICKLPAYQDDVRCLSEAQIGSGLAESALSPTGITHTDNAGDLIIKFVNFVLPYLTLAAFVGFVVAGVFYVTAYGNEEQLQKAKKILIWSAVGLILVIASYAIVQLLTSELLGNL